MQHRKAAFHETGHSNIDKYNAVANANLKRMIFACDEIAEALDKTRFSKERKELVSQIESHLLTIARQRRAFGLHLILATQRPSATILNGQIRSNIDCRICGRADNILSQMSRRADTKRRTRAIITNTGVIFQSCLFNDSEVFSDSHEQSGGFSLVKKKGTIPKHELEALAEVIYPALKEYLESVEGKAAFQKWQKEQKKLQNVNCNKKISRRGIAEKVIPRFCISYKVSISLGKHNNS